MEKPWASDLDVPNLVSLKLVYGLLQLSGGPRGIHGGSLQLAFGLRRGANPNHSKHETGAPGCCQSLVSRLQFHLLQLSGWALFILAYSPHEEGDISFRTFQSGVTPPENYSLAFILLQVLHGGMCGTGLKINTLFGYCWGFLSESQPQPPSSQKRAIQ